MKTIKIIDVFLSVILQIIVSIVFCAFLYIFSSEGVSIGNLPMFELIFLSYGLIIYLVVKLFSNKRVMGNLNSTSGLTNFFRFYLLIATITLALPISIFIFSLLLYPDINLYITVFIPSILFLYFSGDILVFLQLAYFGRRYNELNSTEYFDKSQLFSLILPVVLVTLIIYLGTILSLDMVYIFLIMLMCNIALKLVLLYFPKFRKSFFSWTV